MMSIAFHYLLSINLLYDKRTKLQKALFEVHVHAIISEPI